MLLYKYKNSQLKLLLKIHLLEVVWKLMLTQVIQKIKKNYFNKYYKNKIFKRKNNKKSKKKNKKKSKKWNKNFNQENYQKNNK